MIYLNYHGVVAATAVGPMGPGRPADVVAPRPDPAQALWAGDVDDAVYYFAHVRSRPSAAGDQDVGPKA